MMVLSLLPAASRLKSSCRTTCRSTSRNPSPAKAATSNKAINASRQYCADRTAVVSGLCFSCFKSRAQVKRRFGALGAQSGELILLPDIADAGAADKKADEQGLKRRP